MPAACATLGIKRPLLVTDEGLRDAPMIRRARELVPAGGLFARVRGNPVAANIEAGLAAYPGGAPGGAIAFGGGRGRGARHGNVLLSPQPPPARGVVGR